MWASIAEIVGAIAIVLSLIYVVYELNRATDLLDSDKNWELLDPEFLRRAVTAWHLCSGI
jgi:hypothetical protein